MRMCGPVEGNTSMGCDSTSVTSMVDTSTAGDSATGGFASAGLTRDAAFLGWVFFAFAIGAIYTGFLLAESPLKFIKYW